MEPETSGVIWAMGGKGSADLAHAYLSKKALKEADCLCGRGVKPHIIFDSWNLSNELIASHTCPQCRERVKLLKYMREEKSLFED